MHDAAQSAPARPASSPAAAQTERASAPPKRLCTTPPRPTDDEILGITSGVQPISERSRSDAQEALNLEAGNAPGSEGASPATRQPPQESADLRAVLDANPDLRAAWDDAQAYRETFATPEEARKATALLADLDRMDALFFSSRPEDHAELARAVAALDPAAFASLAQAMGHLADTRVGARNGSAGLATSAVPGAPEGSAAAAPTQSRPAETRPQDPGAVQAQGLAQTQSEFFHAANAATVQGVIDAIESQVDRLLPEGISKSARSRVVGEIYRELDVTLRSNRQLTQQMREAFRSGSLDADHQRAIVSLITGRARQELPAVAKRVLNEWTSTLVAAGQERRSRQRSAERRVDIAGSGGAGNDGRSTLSPREIDYARMSDSDILNL